MKTPHKWFRYPIKTYEGGLTFEKRYRACDIPIENEYRVLEMSNTAQFPSNSGPARLLMNDILRSGNYFDYDDDGIGITRYIRI